MPIGFLYHYEIHQDLTTKSNPFTSASAAGKEEANKEMKWMLCSTFLEDIYKEFWDPFCSTQPITGISEETILL